MKLQSLVLVFLLSTFTLYLPVVASPVELSPEPTSLAANAFASSPSKFELLGGNATYSSSRINSNIAHAAAPRDSEDHHTKLKVVVLFVIFIGIIVVTFVLYCCWKHKKLLMMLL